MDRRNALTALTGVAAASVLMLRPVLAETTAPVTPGTPDVTVLGDAEYKMRTLLVGTLAKQTSMLAMTRATHPKVAEFAQFEFNEQTAMAQVLTDMTAPPPVPLDAPHQAILTQLQAMQGRSFDAAYVLGQIAGHQQLMTIQQDFLNGVPTNRDHEHIAILARQAIQMHLTLLQDLQKMLGSA